MRRLLLGLILDYTEILNTIKGTNLHAKMAFSIKRRSKEYVRTIFDKYAPEGFMAKSELSECMKELNIEFNNQTCSIDGIDGTIDFDEFRALVFKPKSLELWAASLSLSALVADAISAVAPSNDVEDPLQVVSNLDEAGIKLIQEAVGVGIGILLSEQTTSFRNMRAKQNAQDDSETNSKYQVIQMSTGDVHDFHGGLEGRIGMCLAYALFAVRSFMRLFTA